MALLQHSVDGPPSRALTVSAEQACQQSAGTARRYGADSTSVANLPAPFAGSHFARIKSPWIHPSQPHTAMMSLTAYMCFAGRQAAEEPGDDTICAVVTGSSSTAHGRLQLLAVRCANMLWLRR